MKIHISLLKGKQIPMLVVGGMTIRLYSRVYGILLKMPGHTKHEYSFIKPNPKHIRHLTKLYKCLDLFKCGDCEN